MEELATVKKCKSRRKKMKFVRKTSKVKVVSIIARGVDRSMANDNDRKRACTEFRCVSKNKSWQKRKMSGLREAKAYLYVSRSVEQESRFYARSLILFLAVEEGKEEGRDEEGEMTGREGSWGMWKLVRYVRKEFPNYSTPLVRRFLLLLLHLLLLLLRHLRKKPRGGFGLSFGYRKILEPATKNKPSESLQTTN